MINLLYIDLFCGAGGTSTGVEHARRDGVKCAKVIACVNHDANAIASHAANHPDTLHFTEDIRTLELAPLVAHIAKMKAIYPDALVVLWASLECTNFSKAKGGKPREADSRTLAEHLFRYVDAIGPEYLQIENVEEFMCWGDLDENGKPISKDKGRLYLRWVNNVKSRGYNYDHRILNAADFGAYTSRKRFFGIFAKGGLPIVFPEATHTKNPQNGLFEKQKWQAVRDVLDLADQGRSIFERKKPLAENTLERIYAGLVKFVAGGKNQFLSKQFSGHPDSKSISIGTKEEYLHRRTQIQAALRRVQTNAKFNVGGKGRKRKMQPIEHFQKAEKNYIDTKVHEYSRRLVDLAIKNECGTIVLCDHKNLSEEIKENEFLLRNWTYHGLVDKIWYKCNRYGISLVTETAETADTEEKTNDGDNNDK